MTKPMNQVVCANFKRFRLSFLVLLFLILIFYYLLYQIGRQNEKVQLNLVNNDTKNVTLDKRSCFIPTSTDYDDDIILFDDIFEAVKQPTPDRSVFLIETSCVWNGLAALSAR